MVHLKWQLYIESCCIANAAEAVDASKAAEAAKPGT